MKKILILLWPLLLTSCMDELQFPENTYRSNFETLWKIIDQKYCYLETKHINWDSIHDVYENRLSQDTLSEMAFFDAMSSMLNELKDGHVNLYSSFDVSSYDAWYADYPLNFDSRIVKGDRYLGKNYRSINGLRYQKFTKMNNYGYMYDIGYIYYSDFSDNFTESNMKYIFDYFRDCHGLIIDVRNNGGGSADLSETLASYFFKRDTVSIYIQHKTGPGHNQFSPKVAVPTFASTTLKWEKPVVVLANRLSYSATNMFVCRMKDAPLATIVGDVSGGGGGLPMSDELPNGWMVRFSASPMTSKTGETIEFGIAPDIRVDMDSAHMAAGIDDIIEKGIEVIIR